jgi:hypothetical protein
MSMTKNQLQESKRLRFYSCCIGFRRARVTSKRKTERSSRPLLTSGEYHQTPSLQPNAKPDRPTRTPATLLPLGWEQMAGCSKEKGRRSGRVEENWRKKGEAVILTRVRIWLADAARREASRRGIAGTSTAQRVKPGRSLKGQGGDRGPLRQFPRALAGGAARKRMSPS